MSCELRRATRDSDRRADAHCRGSAAPFPGWARLTLLRKLVRAGRLDTSLRRSGHNRFPARQRDELAAARDPLPLSRPLQELPCSPTGRVKRLLADDEVAVRVHELTVAAPVPL